MICGTNSYFFYLCVIVGFSSFLMCLCVKACSLPCVMFKMFFLALHAWIVLLLGMKWCCELILAAEIMCN